MKKTFVGLDIGTTKIVCLIATLNDSNQIEVLGRGKTESIGVHGGDVLNIQKTAESIQKAVQQAEQESGVKVCNVSVGVAGYNVQSHINTTYLELSANGELITEEHIQNLIHDQYKLKLEPGLEIIDVIPQSFKYDAQPYEFSQEQIVGVRAKKLELTYNYIAANKENIKNIKESVQMAGYNVNSLVLQPICSAEAVCNQAEKEAGICLVDIGGGTTDVAIYYKDVVRYTSVIQLAGNVITKDIEQSCHITQKQANMLKEKYGDCIPDSKQANEFISIPSFRDQPPKELSLQSLSSVINYRIKEILEQVLYDIKKSGYEKKLIAGIVLTGGGALFKNITQLTEYITEGISTRVGNPTEQLCENVELNKELKNPIYATVIGLLIHSVQNDNYNTISEKSEPEPESQQPEPKQKPKKTKTPKSTTRMDKLSEWFRNLISDAGGIE
ncbi:MAG: cell division protein FtsA [Bacteroidales bacterium]|nr:cell division protein FtsA [Bacteroidales bacterium]